MPIRDTRPHSVPDRERDAIARELAPPQTILAPGIQRAPFVICSPHSGRVYPQHFLSQSRLDALALRKSEDAYVDDLFGGAAELGVPLIAARFPRAYLDVNREPYELDPQLFEGRLPDYANATSARVIGGLGTVARVVADGEEIYPARLPLSAGLARVEMLYRPFHAALRGLIDGTRARFGYAVLIDGHSMPSAAMAQVGARPDFVLGDRFGASCDPRLTRRTRDILSEMGYDVHLNRPYAGGYITEHYGRPALAQHCLQIEINRGLYLNETTLVPTSGFRTLATHLTVLCDRLFTEMPALLTPRAAAE